MVSLEDGKSKMSWTDYQEKLSRGDMQPIPPHH
jgi:hypothetical protein